MTLDYISEVAHVRTCHVLHLHLMGHTMKSNDTVEFSAKIPTDLYLEFKLLFPQYGSTTWFINAAMEEFLNRVRDAPTLQNHVAQSIEAMLTERREDREES